MKKKKKKYVFQMKSLGNARLEYLRRDFSMFFYATLDGAGGGGGGGTPLVLGTEDLELMDKPCVLLKSPGANAE